MSALNVEVPSGFLTPPSFLWMTDIGNIGSKCVEWRALRKRIQVPLDLAGIFDEETILKLAVPHESVGEING
jgi:hypothetical protein